MENQTIVIKKVVRLYPFWKRSKTETLLSEVACETFKVFLKFVGKEMLFHKLAFSRINASSSMRPRANNHLVQHKSRLVRELSQGWKNDKVSNYASLEKTEAKIGKKHN